MTLRIICFMIENGCIGLDIGLSFIGTKIRIHYFVHFGTEEIHYNCLSNTFCRNLKVNRLINLSVFDVKKHFKCSFRPWISWIVWLKNSVKNWWSIMGRLRVCLWRQAFNDNEKRSIPHIIYKIIDFLIRNLHDFLLFITILKFKKTKDNEYR